ncbi:MAG: sulfatase-like hydrolase/transferase [Deltaproteobacteria bacterium]|nr:sulfatase-like hydrolase/transferase [Deltaproteobacteria bacterium]
MRCAVLLSVSILASCSGHTDTDTDTDTGADTGVAVEEIQAGNVLLLIADDMGVDTLWPEDVSDRVVPETPHIDDLCAQGVRFDNVWSLPTCSPTRSSILTGRYGFRTGVMAPVPPAPDLPADELTLPRVLDDHAPEVWSHASIGKWHLGTDPNEMGWSHYSGLLTGHLHNYESWPRTVDGVTEQSHVYATTQQVDDALDWHWGIEQDRPWLLWLAFIAPHVPFHLPPEDLHDRDLPGTPSDINARPAAYYAAAIEAMDHEIGRLFDTLDDDGDGLPDDTTVVFLGDNGTPWRATQAPYVAEHAKDTPYQGGVHVPMCIAGPRVARGYATPALVSTVDLFATVLGLAGVSLEEVQDRTRKYDSRSLLPLLVEPSLSFREWVYTENFDGTRPDRVNGRAARDSRYKLIQLEVGGSEAYDLSTDPLETMDLLSGDPTEEALQAIETLGDHIEALLCTEPCRP